MKNNWNKILLELSYRVSTGIPDLSNEQHLMKLWDILKEHNWNIDARVELLKNLNEVSIVKNKKSGNVYPVKTFRPQTQTIVKKDATKDDIKKAQQGAGEDEFDKPKEEPKEAQSNGYTGDKDKTLKQGDANKSEEFNKDLPPSDEEFEKKNEKSKNPIPPKPIKLDDIIPNPKFPKRYVKVLERMINSRLTPETKKFSHFSDIPGGAARNESSSR